MRNAHTLGAIMMLTMSVAMLTMVMSMLIMGVNWSIALLILSGVLSAVVTIYYSFESARCLCGTKSVTQLQKNEISEDSCSC